MLQTPQRILIVLMGSVGDVARGLSVANAIKRGNPQHTIGWVVEPASYGLVKLCAAIDTVILFNRKNSISALPGCLKEIHAFKADITLDLQRHAKSGFFSLFSGAKIRIGFNRKDSKEGNFLFQTRAISEQPKDLNKLLHYWEFLKVLDVPLPVNAEVPLQVPVAEKLRDLFGEKKITSLVLGTRWETKRWPTDGYAKLMKLLCERNELVVLVGGKEDVAIGDLLAKQFPTAINLTGKTSLAELCYTIEKSSVVIGPDSGPAHIAATLGTSHITVFGPTDPQRTAPYGHEDLVVQSLVPCRGCYRKKCPGLRTLCMRSISPHQVFEKFQVATAPRTNP